MALSIHGLLRETRRIQPEREVFSYRYARDLPTTVQANLHHRSPESRVVDVVWYLVLSIFYCILNLLLASSLERSV